MADYEQTLAEQDEQTDYEQTLGEYTEVIISLKATQHSAQSSSHNLISNVESPINVFKNQIFILKEEQFRREFTLPFPTFHRHTISQPTYSDDDLIQILRKHLYPTVINGIHTTEDIMGQIQRIYPEYFRSFKVRFSQNRVEDIVNETDQDELILKTHNRAHRNAEENKIQLSEKCYFPKMKSKILTLVK